MKHEGYASLKNFILRSGDTLVVKEHHIRVKFLDIPTTLADFSEEQEWIMDMINTILIEVLGSIAEAERLKIRQRQRNGQSKQWYHSSCRCDERDGAKKGYIL